MVLVVGDWVIKSIMDSSSLSWVVSWLTVVGVFVMCCSWGDSVGTEEVKDIGGVVCIM